MVYNAVRVLGDTPDDKTALFLPASAEECSVLVNNFRRFPNSASPAFSLPKYSSPEKLEFRKVLDSLVASVAPSTFYPPRYIRTCHLFSEGRPSTGEGLHLYQALVILQRAFTKIINGHHAKAENSRRLLQFLKQANFADCLRYYQEYWHYTIDCPLFAPLLITLVCDFCEEHLSPADYKKHVYDGKSRTGYGLSTKTRQRVKACLDENFSLKTLAIPIPFDPNTREGQILVTIASRGTDSDQIRQPSTNIALRPDPTKRVVAPKPVRPPPSKSVPKTTKPPRRLTTSEDEDTGSEGSSLHGRSARSSPQKFPVDSSPIEVDEEEDDGDEVFPPVSHSPVPAPRRSIARAAKAKPQVPEVLLKAPVPAKRQRAASVVGKDQPSTEPPVKKRRTQAAVSKTDTTTPASQPDRPLSPAPVRIQEGEPDYFDDDDSRTSGHQHFLTNPNFTPKAPFSQLIRKTVAQNPRAPKLPFLRAPKWQISDEMKNFGAFINSADTSFSLQGLSRYNYLASRHLQSATSTTLPSPDALYSPNNCLTCLTRGVVCDGGSKLVGACSHCDRTHRSCSNSLGLEDHKDRFLAIHNTIQGYPTDRFRATLDEMGHITTSFETIFNDVRRRLSHHLQEIRANGFDFNVVLSQWVNDNPNHPLDYDLLTWLATFFGWDSACNLSSFLVDPNDTARLEEFLRNNASAIEVAADPSTSSHPTAVPTVSPSSPVASTSVFQEPVLHSRRRPSAAIPSNFTSDLPFHTPPASTTVDEEMEIDEGTSRASVGRALLTEYDDTDEDDEDDEADVVEVDPLVRSSAAKIRK
ncbi:hypothetical protein C8R42DRAFT_715025 [Lentinula raphanica]|nr:hypothetical protein C8R42DRAFT_715025 [Lentinula raphanica]